METESNHELNRMDENLTKSSAVQVFSNLPYGIEVCDIFPEKPQEPSESDCCGSGCQPCVFDIYEQELKLWREECERICLGPLNDASQSDHVMNSTEYHQFEIMDITQESEDSYIYHFCIPGYQSLGLKVGQHIILRWKKSGENLTRQYTPISDVRAKGFFDVLIKIYDEGKMSQYVKSWRIGDKIEWRGPFGNFTYVPNKYQHMVMLAAGTGIAPMVQVIQAVLNNEDDETGIHLVYCCKKYTDLLLKKQLDQWTDYWNFSVTYVLSQESAGSVNKSYGDKIHFGRLSEEMVSEILGNKTDSIFVLICGTKSFDKDMVNYVKRHGLSEQNFKF